jgi:hypothetical protein
LLTPRAKRSWSVLVAFALVLALASVLGASQAADSAPIASAPEIDRAAALIGWWDAENRGDVDGAVAQFADNATYFGTMPMGLCSRQSPCTDLTGIRQQIQRNVGIHFCTKIRWIQVSGAVISGEREIVSDYDYSIGIHRVVQGFLALVPNDKITFAAGVLDAGDPETAQALEIDAGSQPPNTAFTGPREACGAP